MFLFLKYCGKRLITRIVISGEVRTRVPGLSTALCLWRVSERQQTLIIECLYWGLALTWGERQSSAQAFDSWHSRVELSSAQFSQKLVVLQMVFGQSLITWVDRQFRSLFGLYLRNKFFCLLSRKTVTNQTFVCKRFYCSYCAINKCIFLLY